MLYFSVRSMKPATTFLRTYTRRWISAHRGYYYVRTRYGGCYSIYVCRGYYGDDI